jgi:hypothetical protein
LMKYSLNSRVSRVSRISRISRNFRPPPLESEEFFFSNSFVNLEH